ncbi:MAG: N-acetyltransferase [Alphaproteobacteria bacterium]|nr:N-acetyltransferase [Alphaproteobacteria bacterium]
MIVRPETGADWFAIDNVNRRAFGGPDEAELVHRLRAQDALVSLVTEDGNEVGGHLMLSRLAVVAGDRKIAAAALAPVAVLPERQRQGIGSQLVRASIVRARELAIEAIIVLGHPDYYPRFGFSAEAAAGLKAPFSGAPLMVLKLAPGCIAGKSGAVTYPAAFGIRSPAAALIGV